MATKKVSFEAGSLEDLENKMLLLKEEYETKLAQEKGEAIKQVLEIVARFKITPAEVGLTPKTKKEEDKTDKRAKAIPMYKDPNTGKTWSNRGLPPKWIREHEETGGKREDFLIK